MKLNKIFNNIFALGAALSLVAVGCQQKEAYTPGDPDLEGCQKVYFPTQDFSSYAYLSPDAECAIEVKIARELDDEAIVVPVEVKANEDGVFEVEEVRFEAGQKETSFVVTFDKSEIGKQYNATFFVSDPKYASKYPAAPTFITFKTMRVEWLYVLDESGEPAQFTFEEGWYGETHYGKVKYYEIEGVRYCETETEPMEYKDGTGYGFFGLGEAPGEGELSLVWYPNLKTPEGYDAVELKPYNLGDVAGYGVDVWMWDWWNWWTVYNPQAAFEGKDFAYFVKNYYANYNCSYYNNGIFAIHTAYYYMDGVGGWKQDKKETVMTADGFTRIDYTFEMEADYTVEGVLPVYFKAGADVASIKVAAAQGELAAKAIEELAGDIAEGKVGDDVSMEELAAGLTFEETDMYTVVAVAFNEAGEAVNASSLSAFYVTLEDQEDYAVEASVGFEAAPARYELDPCTTAAYWIAGHDLTEVHMTVAKASNVTAKLLASVKSDSKYALSDDELEQVNAKGGLYDYLTGLTPNTEYALIVWATNGSMDKYWALTYTTEKLPYVWNLLGEGTLTEPFTTMFGEDALVLSVDVYEDENTPGIYMYKGAGLQLANWFYEQDMTPYEGQYWDDEGIIFDATDPNKVVIDNQFYGFNAGSSYGWPVLTTIANGQTVGYGKLADGHLTLTAREYLVGMGTSFYYGPAGYDLALPSASTKAVPTKVNYVEKHEQSGRTIVSAPAFAKEKIAIERDTHVVDAKIVKIAPKANSNRNSAPKAVKLDSIR